MTGVGFGAPPLIDSNRFVLVEAFDAERSESRIWTATADELKRSQWDAKSRIKLSLERAIEIGRMVFPSQILEYVEFRRPSEKCPDVFFYFLEFDKDQLAILLDGTIIQPRIHKQ